MEFIAWSEATTSFAEAILTAHDALKYGYLARIVYLPNEEQKSPLKRLNPLLDNPHNWSCSSRFHMSEDELKAAVERAGNETEKDLILNWDWIFADAKALETYQETGKVTKGLFEGVGTCGNIKKQDAYEFFKKSDPERAKLFVEPTFFTGGLWSPKRGIERWVPVTGIKTFAVLVSREETYTKEDQDRELNKSIAEVAIAITK